MRYTKYNYKKKNEGVKFLKSLIMTTIAAISIGLIGAWLILKFVPNFGKGQLMNPPESEKATMVNINENSTFSLIQCGYFSNEENAKKAIAPIQNNYNSFIYKDDTGKFRIVAGIYVSDNAIKVTDDLKSKGIENAKIDYKLDTKDNVQVQIAAITNGFLDIINTIEDKEVKEVNTSDFKAWIDGLEPIENGKKIEVLKEYKEHIKALPDVLKKDNQVNEVKYIYTILNKIKA